MSTSHVIRDARPRASSPPDVDRTTKAHVHFGLYEFTLIEASGDWKIVRKKTVLQNDLIPTVVDFYNL